MSLSAMIALGIASALSGPSSNSVQSVGTGAMVLSVEYAWSSKPQGTSPTVPDCTTDDENRGIGQCSDYKRKRPQPRKRARRRKH